MTTRLQPSDIWRGMTCTWVHSPPGAYGYEVRIPVTVVGLPDDGMVRIEITARNGLVARRRVPVGNLIARRLSPNR